MFIRSLIFKLKMEKGFHQWRNFRQPVKFLAKIGLCLIFVIIFGSMLTIIKFFNSKNLFELFFSNNKWFSPTSSLFINDQKFTENEQLKIVALLTGRKEGKYN